MHNTLSDAILKRDLANLSINISLNTHSSIQHNAHANEINVSNRKTRNKTDECKLDSSLGSKETKSNSFTDSITLDTELTEIPSFKALNPSILNSIYKQIIREDRTSRKHIIDLSKHSNISEIHCAVLIDWIINVHSYLSLSDECLFLSAKIVREYLARVNDFNKESLQLLGVTSMLVASKFIERRHIAIDELCSLCEMAYTKKQIIAFEHILVQTLEFKIEQDDIINFFDLLAMMFNFTLREYYQGKFMLELTLLEIGMAKYRRTIVAFSVAYLVMKMNIERHPHYQKCFFYLKDRESTESLLKECGRGILHLLDNIKASQYTSSLQKFSALISNN